MWPAQLFLELAPGYSPLGKHISSGPSFVLWVGGDTEAFAASPHFSSLHLSFPVYRGYSFLRTNDHKLGDLKKVLGTEPRYSKVMFLLRSGRTLHFPSPASEGFQQGWAVLWGWSSHRILPDAASCPRKPSIPVSFPSSRLASGCPSASLSP